MKEGEGKVSAEEVKRMSKSLKSIRDEVSKVIYGQEKVIEGILRAVLCDSHVLLEGVPGIAKTLMVKSLSDVLGCNSKRIQFTSDMLPSDIIGIVSYRPNKGFEVIKGPIFSNFIIADEINRSPPKTQSAMLEVMQERQVTVGRNTYKLDLPFFVMATQNPIETSGVYPLPEALVDRFLFKLLMSYPTPEQEKAIMENNVTLKKFSDFNLKAVSSPSEIIRMQKITKRIYLNDKIKSYILKIIEKTRDPKFNHGTFIEYGASPRASIGIYIASKAQALINGRNFVIPQDVRDVVPDVLRHRIILSYKARAEGITPDKIISEILEKVSAD